MTSLDQRLTAAVTTTPPPAETLERTAPDMTARRLLSRGQVVTGSVVAGGLGALLILRWAFGLGPSALWWGRAVIATVTAIYVAVLVFRTAVLVGGWRSKVIEFGAATVRGLADDTLPVYTVLVPLYREAKVLPRLLERLRLLDYPRDRLQILLLVEEDDAETRTAMPELEPPFEVVLIPPSHPRTKPKACNVGLARARGEFVVIYDAEDRPDRDQLRKAILAFRGLPDRVVCVQAELQYWNPWTNWLTRCFAAEYAANFSLMLRGLDRHRLAIPLGGTSNHFHTGALRALGGWDPYNVTEDADLGIRIARRGWDVRMMLSVTEEEANSRLGNWIRQRSRWIKGYIQTWLVHTRHPVLLWRQLGTRRTVAFHLTMGFSTLTTLVNPFFWALTLIYVCSGTRYVAALFPAVPLYFGTATLVAGNLLMIYCMMAGCLERGLFRAVRAMLTIPLYWALMSVAAYKAVFQLLRPSRRHFWELTDHGLVEDDATATHVARRDPSRRWWRCVGAAIRRPGSRTSG
ncbi:glycosyltransferase [Spongiactinospora sp. TRM90649]|uniref:glycosyltransferase n=1 Tax=Spongiactinospora sp. TRM90649 TaxID=3031114 RepID=UPI0023F625E8|nr:glycosyltransferase [Spongiactinospora sp. TRM90649]MDF5753626.1 glycosyltransferase [Spongiactinospora sp. TRM90649]